MKEVRRIALIDIVEQPMLLEMIEWRCWNMLGVGVADLMTWDIITGDAVFYAKEAAPADNAPALKMT